MSQDIIDNYLKRREDADAQFDVFINEIAQYTMERISNEFNGIKILSDFIQIFHVDSNWKHEYVLKNENYEFYNRNGFNEERAVCRDFADDFLFSIINDTTNYSSFLNTIIVRLATGLLLKTSYLVQKRRFEKYSLPVIDSFIEYVSIREGFTNLKTDYSIIELDGFDLQSLEGNTDKKAYIEFYSDKIINFLTNVRINLNLDYEYYCSKRIQELYRKS